MKTQNQEVLEHLQAGNTLTSGTAFKNMRITRLAARIHDLRQSGHQILSETIRRRSKRTGRLVRYESYYL